MEKQVPIKVKDLLKPGEVAKLFRVDSKTVGKWARDGKLKALTTPGGHRRFSREEVETLLKQLTAEATVPPGRLPNSR